MKSQLVCKIQKSGDETTAAETVAKPDEVKRPVYDAPRLHGTEEEVHLDPLGSSGDC